MPNNYTACLKKDPLKWFKGRNHSLVSSAWSMLQISQQAAIILLRVKVTTSAVWHPLDECRKTPHRQGAEDMAIQEKNQPFADSTSIDFEDERGFPAMLATSNQWTRKPAKSAVDLFHAHRQHLLRSTRSLAPILNFDILVEFDQAINQLIQQILAVEEINPGIPQ